MYDIVMKNFLSNFFVKLETTIARSAHISTLAEPNFGNRFRETWRACERKKKKNQPDGRCSTDASITHQLVPESRGMRQLSKRATPNMKTWTRTSAWELLRSTKRADLIRC